MFTSGSSKSFKKLMARGKYKNYNQSKSYQIQKSNQGNEQKNNQKAMESSKR